MVDFISNDPAKIGECEFFLISEMNSQLIVHHPYRTVLELSKMLELTPEDINQATNLISDHYQTDLPLLYAPHIIAVMAILLAVIFGSSNNQQLPHLRKPPSVLFCLFLRYDFGQWFEKVPIMPHQRWKRSHEILWHDNNNCENFISTSIWP